MNEVEARAIISYLKLRYDHRAPLVSDTTAFILLGDPDLVFNNLYSTAFNLVVAGADLAYQLIKLEAELANP